MNPLKRLEHYVSAIFTLGRIKLAAKEGQRGAARQGAFEEIIQERGQHLLDRIEAEERALYEVRHQLSVLDPRLAHAHERLDGVEPRIDGIEDRLGDVLPHLIERGDHAHVRLDSVGHDLAAMQAALDAHQKHLTDVDGRHNALRDSLARFDALADQLVADYRRERDVLTHAGQSEHALLARMFTDLSRRLDSTAASEPGLPQAPSPPAAGASALAEGQEDLLAGQGFALFKDQFYHRLENAWRGAPAEIAHRLKIYLPDMEAAWIRTDNKPALDLGCGRGEWLGLLSGRGITAFGIDVNGTQIEEAQAAGLDARLGDALAVLAEQPDNSLSAVTAHHLIEHLPFDAVAWIVREAGRVLAPGGILLFETPNTRNVLVGATTFHTDPTHLKPMPEQVMGVLLETAGFDPVETRGINPHERLGEFLDRPGFDDELAMLLFGPQDLAILGTKPAPTPEAS